MKEEFSWYLTSIGVPELLIQRRIEPIYHFYEDICPEGIADIFVTDYISQDGSRNFENLWFFSDECCMEAKQFRIKDDFDSVRFKNRIVYWSMQKEKYDFKEATEASRLSLHFLLDSRVDNEFRAARQNCDHLRDIFLKYVMKNMRE